MNLKTKSGIVAIIAIFFQTNALYAQWQLQPIIGGNFIRTQKKTRAVVVGNYSGPLCPGVNPSAAFQVNTNCLNSTPLFNAGEVFLTDCPTGEDTYWRLLRAGTEYGALYNLFSGSDLYIRASAGNMRLFTQDIATGIPKERMQIDTEGNITVNSLACDNCLVMADENGKLYARNFGSKKQKKAHIAALQARITQLENKMNEIAMANNQ